VITPLKRSGMAHVLKESHSFTCTPAYSDNGMNHTCGTHLTTPEGWKAELALGGWLAANPFCRKSPSPVLRKFWLRAPALTCFR